jgi:hypothetical protein
VLLRLLQEMFPEGQGKPNAKAKLGSLAPKVNALFVNAKEAVGKFFKARGYDPKRPQYTKEKLGYALDQYEAIAFVTTRVMGYALMAPEGDEVRTIAKRCNNLLTPLERKLKETRKRGARAADERERLLGAKAALNLEMPARKAPAPAPAPAPEPAPAPAPSPALPPASIPWGARPLSHAQKLRKRSILDVWSNDACTCAERPVHSMFCQIYKCYAYEIGSCDPEIHPFAASGR